MNLTAHKPSPLATVGWPFIYEIRDEDGNRFRHCGSARDRDLVLSNYPTYTAHVVPLAPPPRTIDVEATEVAMEKQLTASEALPLDI